MDWKKKLKSYVATGSGQECSQETEQDQKNEWKLFSQLYVDWKGESSNKAKSYKQIPRFYYRYVQVRPLGYPALIMGF